MKVKDIMTKDVVTAKTDATVEDVARKMNEHNVGCVVVTDNDGVTGLVTDREIVVHCVGKGNNPKEMRVREIMHENPVTCKEDDTIWQAAEKTFNKERRPFRRLPVVGNNDTLVGIVSVADFALVAHPLVEAAIAEMQSSVQEAKIEQVGLKDQVREHLPQALRS